MLRVEAEKLDVYVGGDMLIDGEIESHEIIGVDIVEFNVVEIEDGEASVSVLCEVSVSADPPMADSAGLRSAIRRPMRRRSQIDSHARRSRASVRCP